MEVDEDRSDFEKEEDEEDDSVSDLLRDRFRLSAISIAEYEAKRNGMEISQPIVACIADLAFKYIGQLAKDLELFAHHAGRKSVTMADVIVSAHRNEHLAASLRSFHDELKAKETQCERKRKKVPRKDDKAIDGIVSIPDL
ncbi:homolog of human MHF1 [Hibiscus trionum]|uniref:Homolog of human MHF1 n=1 Tax=Hibiscus trionum TaxID=183268 RepID=A0A9W7MEL6_HIBTR|nr:homolog of human MHF1 [Hibiscus trionum]